MIISFANQKGGCGKSSIALLLGAYLKNIHKRKVIGVDTDKQRSFLGRFNKDKSLLENPLYEVEYSEPLDFVKKIKAGVLDKETIYLVDTPNQLNKETLALLILSDRILIPYNYSKVSMESTSTFTTVIMKLTDNKVKNRLLLIANNIIQNARKETLENYQKLLSDYTDSDCVINNYFKASVNFQRFDSLNIPNNVIEANKLVLDEIYSKLLNK